MGLEKLRKHRTRRKHFHTWTSDGQVGGQQESSNPANSRHSGETAADMHGNVTSMDVDEAEGGLVKNEEEDGELVDDREVVSLEGEYRAARDFEVASDVATGIDLPE